MRRLLPYHIDRCPDAAPDAASDAAPDAAQESKRLQAGCTCTGSKADGLHRLRQVVAKLERRGKTPVLPVLPFGIGELDASLPGGGLTCGLLHEIVPLAHRERP